VTIVSVNSYKNKKKTKTLTAEKYPGKIGTSGNSFVGVPFHPFLSAKGMSLSSHYIAASLVLMRPPSAFVSDYLPFEEDAPASAPAPALYLQATALYPVQQTQPSCAYESPCCHVSPLFFRRAKLTWPFLRLEFASYVSSFVAKSN